MSARLSLSRRGMMTSVFALLAGAGARPASATIKRVLRGRQGGGGGGALTPIGPHTGWIASGGTADSGEGVPVQSVTITAKPQAGWGYGWTLDRMTGSYLLCVMAHGNLGIEKVEVHGDCVRTANTAATVRAVPKPGHATGTISIYGHWFELDGAAFRAVNETTSKAHIYATATSNDGTQQTRVIGGDGFGTGSATAANWKAATYMPMVLYPRALAVTATKTVGAGKNYATLDAAFAAISSWAEKAPEIVVYDSGVQLVTPHNATQYDGNEGYIQVRTMPGVTSTIRSSNTFDPLNASDSWDLWLGGNQMMFHEGIVIDTLNSKEIKGGSEFKPFRFHCTLTNSKGSRTEVSRYWNGGAHPGFGTGFGGSGRGIMSYWDACTIDNVDCLGGAHRVLWNTTDHVLGGRRLGTRVSAYNAFNDTGLDPDYPSYGSIITVNYTGGPNAYFDFQGGDTATICYGELFKAGVSIFKVEWPSGLRYRPYQAAAGVYCGQRTSEVVAALNAKAASLGLSGEINFVQNGTDGDLWPSFVNNGGWRRLNLKGFDYVASGVVAGTGTAIFTSGSDYHTEIHQFFSATEPDVDDNYLQYADKNFGCSYSTAMYTGFGFVGTWVKKNCVDTKSVDSGSAMYVAAKQLIIENCYSEDGFRDRDGGCGAWSSIRQNAFGQGFTKRQMDPGNGTWADFPKKRDNFFVTFVDGTPAGVNDSNNTPITNAAWKALVVNWIGGDFHAAPGGGLATTTATSINPYDINNLPRAATDIFGAHRLAA